MNGGAPAHGVLAPLIDLGMEIAHTAGIAGDGDGGDDGGGGGGNVDSRGEGTEAEAEAGAEEHSVLLRWLLSAVHAPLVRPAFEATAPWVCVAQLGREAAQRREGSQGKAVCAAVARLVCGGAEEEAEEGAEEAEEAEEAGVRLAGLTRLVTGWSGGAAGWDTGRDSGGEAADEAEVGGSGEGG